MTLLDDLHAAHKQRLARISSAALNLPVPRTTPAHPDMASIVREVNALKSEIVILKDQLKSHTKIIGKFVLPEVEEGESKPKFSEIIEAVCEYYDVTRNDLTSARRTALVTMPRQVACYLARNLTGMSFPQIGRRLGCRDHTTVLHGANKIHRLLGGNEVLLDDINILQLRIGEKVMKRRYGPNVETFPATS